MVARRIVLDANILIRAMRGVKVGRLLSTYAESFEFCAPSIAFEDAEAIRRRSWQARDRP
ncbi:hypothetical protein [Microbacterium sp.]|uniref:hypothetical protein n=1 Tax=Microbacterium sp. TaxID=51671 RepID=UPI003C71D0A0